MALRSVFTKHPQLRVIYEDNFRNDQERRSAFIVRCHEIPNGYAASWIRDELHAMSSDPNTLNPVATFTQEHPIVIPRGTTNPPMYSFHSEV